MQVCIMAFVTLGPLTFKGYIIYEKMIKNDIL